jgi:hypothetical protein
MKLRHGAALALAGCYLMYPLDYMRAGNISGWAVIGSTYNTAKECRAARWKFLKAQKKRDSDLNGVWGDQDFPIQGLEMSQCINAANTKLWARDLEKDVRATPGQTVHPYSGPNRPVPKPGAGLVVSMVEA